MDIIKAFIKNLYYILIKIFLKNIKKNNILSINDKYFYNIFSKYYKNIYNIY